MYQSATNSRREPATIFIVCTNNIRRVGVAKASNNVKLNGDNQKEVGLRN